MFQVGTWRQRGQIILGFRLIYWALYNQFTLLASWDFPGGLDGKESTCNTREDPLEKEMATHSSILAWKTPRSEEPWWATVHGVAKTQT